MLESFLQSQKISVRSRLQKNFKKYVTYGEENNELLMYKLKNLIIDAEKYKKVIIIIIIFFLLILFLNLLLFFCI
jgi:hypothetical protein